MASVAPVCAISTSCVFITRGQPLLAAQSLLKALCLRFISDTAPWGQIREKGKPATEHNFLLSVKEQTSKSNQPGSRGKISAQHREVQEEDKIKTKAM